jgi:hypothetical protein
VKPLDRRAVRLWAGLFLAALLVGGWPLEAPRAAFARAYAAIATGVLAGITFGHGGHATLVADAGPSAPGAAVEQDARLLLTVADFEGELPFGLNLRRDAYLPTLVLVGAVLGAPLVLRRKLLCLALGVASVLLLSLACVALTAAWLFASQLQGVYAAGSLGPRLLDLIAGALLLPPANRFALPLVLAVALVLWLGRRQPLPATA